jgi:DNA-binding NarL/FixJ family response regulator
MLVVEDNARMRAALLDHLREAFPGFDICESGDGAGAVEQCRQRAFSVVLLDIGLPDVNGLDLIEAIRALRPACSIIVVSQNTQRAYRERARALGAVAYVAKDELFRELAPAIEGALRHAAPR